MCCNRDRRGKEKGSFPGVGYGYGYRCGCGCRRECWLDKVRARIGDRFMMRERGSERVEWVAEG